jgi:hypothetical protein
VEEAVFRFLPDSARETARLTPMVADQDQGFKTE